MPWIKLDDRFFDNDKIVAAGKDARDLYLAGLCYCARSLTDGFIPEERVSRLAIEASIADGKEVVKRLCTVIRGKQFPLWETVDGGYQVHDYLEYNPTREEELERRAKRAEAGRLGGQRSGETRRSKRSEREARASAQAKQMLRSDGAESSPDAGNEVTGCEISGYQPTNEAQLSKHEANTEAKTKQTRSKNEPRSRTPIHEKQPAPAGVAEDATRKPARPHQVFFAVMCRIWGPPANDLERGRYNKAAQNFEQAGILPDDLPALKDAYVRRWPHMECTPIAVAVNAKTLRQPAPKLNGGRAIDNSEMAGDMDFYRQAMKDRTRGANNAEDIGTGPRP